MPRKPTAAQAPRTPAQAGARHPVQAVQGGGKGRPGWRQRSGGGSVTPAPPLPSKRKEAADAAVFFCASPPWVTAWVTTPTIELRVERLVSITLNNKRPLGGTVEGAKRENNSAHSSDRGTFFHTAWVRSETRRAIRRSLLCAELLQKSRKSTTLKISRKVDLWDLSLLAFFSAIGVRVDWDETDWLPHVAARKRISGSRMFVRQPQKDCCNNLSCQKGPLNRM